MAIDIRATCTCSLGTLISASVSDDYLQGNGLVKVKGSAVISGVITPDVGTIVTFSYTKGGVTKDLPRKLRVLSSFADPFRGTTTVELGCKLTYLQDKKDPVKWEWYDDDENNDYTEEDAKIATISIKASSVMTECLTQLGITASSNPLTNKFSVVEFDYSPGYVQILGDLLVSECYFGYLDFDEVLQVISLDQEGGTGPVFDNTNIIDIGPIGVGQLPGDAVTVSYSTLKLDPPDNNATDPLWEQSSTSSRSDILITYEDSEAGTVTSVVYPNLETSQTTTTYREIQTNNGKVNVVSSRKTVQTSNVVAVLGNLASECLKYGIPFNNGETTTITEETFKYDSEGNEIFHETLKTGTAAHIAGESSLPLVFDLGGTIEFITLDFGRQYPMAMTRVYSTINGEVVQAVTETYGSWFRTISGQQALAAARDAFTTANQVDLFIEAAVFGGLKLLNVSVESGVTSYRGQSGPRTQAVVNAQNAANGGTGDPNNGYRTSSKAELALASGSKDAQLRVEFSMPYAPDDDMEPNYGGGFYSIQSDADAKAVNFGRVQNMLLLGNRSGMNVQVAPEVLPEAPYSPVIVSAAGYAALYRTNATTFTLDASGIVASSDLLFIGGVGTV